MKSLVLVVGLFLLPSLASAAEPAWLQERLISKVVSENLQGPGQVLPLRRILQLPPMANVNDIIITAATAGGRGRMELFVDGYSMGSVVVERRLKAITFPVNMRLQRRSDIQLRTDGMFYIAEVAATIAREGGSGPLPPPNDGGRACDDFAFAEFRAEGYSNTDSLNLAQQYCTQNRDLFYHRAEFDRVYALVREEGYGRRDSLNKAAELVRKNGDVLALGEMFDRFFKLYRDEGYGRVDSLNLACAFLRDNLTSIQYREMDFTWVFDRMREDGYGRVDSAKLAVEVLARVRADVMNCVQDKFELFRKDGYGRRDSINKAAEYCSR